MDTSAYRVGHLRRLLSLAIGLAPLLALSNSAEAVERAGSGAASVAEPKPVEPAHLTLVSLNKQRMWVYGADGLIATSRVSTGTPGYDTPRGIYSILQKKEDHTSNIYEGAPMPHMQRLLWTGIAMHGGEVPRHPASHGCVRLPWDFAKSYFAMTRLHHRVVVSPNVRAPVRFDHPLLPRPLPERDPEEARLTPTRFGTGTDAVVPAPLTRTKAAVAAERSIEYARLVDADVAAKEALEASRRSVDLEVADLKSQRERVSSARAEVARLEKEAVKAARAATAAEAKAKDRMRRLEARAAKLRADALEKLRVAEAVEKEKATALRARSDDVSRELQMARNALAGYQRLLGAAERRSIEVRKAHERTAALEAEAARAIDDFRREERNRVKPVAVLISRATGRISLRQGQESAGEAEVEIENSSRPLGTYVFTATGWRNEARTELEWTALSDDEKGLVSNPLGSNRDAKDAPPPTDIVKAGLVLDRIRIPDAILTRIAEVVKPGSSLIVTDYDMARSETGKGTDFIVQMPEVVAQVAAKPKKTRYSASSRSLTSYYPPSRKTVRPIRYYRPPPSSARGLFGYY